MDIQDILIIFFNHSPLENYRKIKNFQVKVLKNNQTLIGEFGSKNVRSRKLDTWKNITAISNISRVVKVVLNCLQNIYDSRGVEKQKK